MDVEERRQKCWNKILEEKIIIPANNIKVFDSDGNLAGKMVYTLGDVTYEPHSTSAFPTLEYHPLIQEGNSHTHESSSHTHEGSSHTQDDNQGHSLGEGHTDSSSSYIHLTVQPTDTGMKTTLAGSISSILQSDNTELKQFDELRFSLKRKKGNFVT